MEHKNKLETVSPSVSDGPTFEATQTVVSSIISIEGSTNDIDSSGVEKADNKQVIRITPGELHNVVDAAEQELAKHGYYQWGGLIASVLTLTLQQATRQYYPSVCQP